MRAEDAGGVALARADGAQVTEQRAQGRALDPHVGAEQVLAVVIEERAADRRLEEGDATLMTWSGPGVLAVAVVARERGGERRQQALDVALDRGGGAAADECRGVFEDPDELVDQRGDFHGDRARDAAVRHEKHRHFRVSRTQRAEQLGRLLVRATVFLAVLLAEGPAEEDAVERG